MSDAVDAMDLGRASAADTSRTPANVPRSCTASSARARARKHGLEFVPRVSRAAVHPANRQRAERHQRDARRPPATASPRQAALCATALLMTPTSMPTPASTHDRRAAATAATARPRQHAPRRPPDGQLGPEAQDPVEEDSRHRRGLGAAELHQRDGEASFHHTQAPGGDGQVGGELAGAVGEEQAPPRDPRPDGQERQRQAPAVEDPVGHPPCQRPRATWRHVRVTTVSRVMMLSTWAASSPRGQPSHAPRGTHRPRSPATRGPGAGGRPRPERARPPARRRSPRPGRARPPRRRRRSPRPRPPGPGSPTRRRTPPPGSTPARASSAPWRRYWRKANTADTTGPGRHGVGDGRRRHRHRREPAGRHVDAARLEQAPLDQGERHERPRLGHDGEGQPPPAEMGEVAATPPTARRCDRPAPTGPGRPGPTRRGTSTTARRVRSHDRLDAGGVTSPRAPRGS